MSKIEVNTVAPQCGTTLTLGESGDTVTLGSGASQSGFGRTGTVDWQTTKKTLAFTAANGEGYFVDTAASGAVTMTLPASPSAGNIVAVKDYNGNFATANLTIARNGSPINGASSADVTINTDGASIVLVYVDATQGWVATQDDASDISGESFITATGGTTADCGNFRIHTFTGPGTFAVSAISGTPANNAVDYLIIGGGGGGGNNAASGGGAGGYRETPGTSTGSYSASPIAGSVTALTATATSFPVTVGAGGNGKSDSPTGVGNAGQGSDSTFNSQTSAGGGKGFNGNKLGESGGSGSGGVGGTPPGTSNPFAGGTGNTPPTSPAQGNDGGRGFDGIITDTQGGGGGGAGGVGGNAGPAAGGNGGNGIATSITGSSVTRGGGGGGSADNGGNPGGTAGAAGPGGGGAAAVRGGSSTGGSGTANTGGGGGAAAGPSASNTGGSGGSGVVIIRYRFQ